MASSSGSAPSRVRLLTDVVVKTGTQSRIELEVAVTNAVQDLARSSREFQVPRVLEYDVETGTFVMERIKNWAPLSAVSEPRIVRQLMSSAGRVLALVHVNLLLPRSVRVPPSVPAISSGRVGAVHGDFNATNVGVDIHSGKLVILDWSSAPAYGAAFTVATQELDVAHFARSLFLSHEAGRAIPPKESWRVFKASYESAGGQIDKEGLHRMAGFVTTAGVMKQLRQGRVRSVFRSLKGAHRLASELSVNE